MLIFEPAVIELTRSFLHNQCEVHEIVAGVYDIMGFSFYIDSHLEAMLGYTRSPDLSTDDGWGLSHYGVCDNYEDILHHKPIIRDSDRKFIILLNRVRKKDQERVGGWRWHKHGEYIGKHEITTEYLYHEPVVEEVYTYSIMEKDPQEYEYDVVCVSEKDPTVTQTFTVRAHGPASAKLSARPGKDWYPSFQHKAVRKSGPLPPLESYLLPRAHLLGTSYPSSLSTP